MAITTDSLITVESGGITYDTIGLSKTLNNYTAAEIWDYIFCSASSNNLYHIGYGSGGMNYYTYQGNDNYVPFELRYVATNHNNFYYHPEQIMNNPDGLYMRVIWLQRTSNGSDSYITNSNGNNYKLITMFNAPHYVYECNTPRLVDNDHGSTSWNVGGYLYYSDGGSLYYYDDVTAETPTRISINRVVPAIIFKDKNDKVYIIPYRQGIGVLTSVQNTQSGGWNPSTAYNFYDFSGTNCIAFPVVINTAYQYCNGSTGELTSPYSDGSRLPEGSGIYPRPMYATTTINHLIAFFSCGGSDLTLGFRVNNYFRDVENCKKFFSLAGLHFKADKIYKPIIEGGYVTGFTDVLTTSSELDNWDGKTKHEVPPSPPSPTPSGDDIDDQHFGGGTSLGGAENLWLLTTAQMNDLHAALSSCSEVNFDPMQSIISVIGLAIPPTYPLGTDISTLITITFKKADGTRWSSHVEGHICDKQTASFGFTNNIKIKRRYNNFLDFPPYANHEIFLPLCGWLPLPAYAVGRNLNVYYVHDINTCSVRALVLCEGSLIGEKYGTMGANIAFSSNGHSLYLGGLITGGVQTLADFTMALTGEGPMALMSAMKGIADGANTLVSANQNRTSVIGQNQDRTSFADGQYIRIKSTYPDVKIEENFGHTYGFVCNKKGKLKEFSGFTTCENPHVTGFSCTSTEKDEIEQLLKSGIIINMSE